MKTFFSKAISHHCMHFQCFKTDKKWRIQWENWPNYSSCQKGNQSVFCDGFVFWRIVSRPKAMRTGFTSCDWLKCDENGFTDTHFCEPLKACRGHNGLPTKRETEVPRNPKILIFDQKREKSVLTDWCCNVYQFDWLFWSLN